MLRLQDGETSLEAAILDFPLPVASGSFTSSSIGMAVNSSTKMGSSRLNIVSSCLAAEILLGSVSPPTISNVSLQNNISNTKVKYVLFLLVVYVLT